MRKIFVVVFLLASSAHGQITADYKETPLEQILKGISESYNLIFSFSNEVVKNKIITLSTNNASLDEVIASLKALTKLEFKKISERQVIISAPDKTIEVCGYLFDEATNAPLPYASILIENTNTGTIANEDGFFQLGFLDETTSIKIVFIGYKEKLMSITDFKNTRCPKIPLFTQSTALEEVLIVEYITKGVGKNIDGSLGVSNEDLGILPGQTEPDILQSIQLIPGIGSPDETATGIQIRGGSPDQNLILWDNIRMYNTGHFFGMISAFNPNIVSETKVLKGGANPKYGDRVSGVIDISSDTEVPEKFSGGTGINGTHGDLFLKTPIGNKAGIIISGRRAYTDFITTPTYEAYFDKVFQNTKIVENPNNPIPDPDEEDEEDEEAGKVTDNNFFFYDASAKIIVDASEHDKILVSGIFTKNDLTFEVNDDEDLLTDELNIQNEGASFSWEGTKFDRLTHSLKGYYSFYDSDYLFTQRQEQLIEEQSIRKNTVEEVGIDLNVGYKLNKKNTIQLGYQLSNNEVFYNITRESEFETPINESDLIKNTANSFYANYTFIPRNKGAINLGLRTSHYSVVDEFYIEPRLNIEYPITRSLRIKATGELRYQPISQLVEFEDTQLRVENSLWIHSDNDEIPILESTQFSGGLLYSNDNWNIEIDGYFKNIDGLTSLTNGFNSLDPELSTGESEITGVDVLVKKRFKNFRTWIGYTFNDVTYTFPEIQDGSFPGNNDITHNFRISNTYELEHWEFSLGWLWRSGAPFTDADLVNDEIEFGTPNAQRLPSYHRLDASITYKFNFNQNRNWRGQLGISALNLYDRQVPLSISYQADENPNTDEVELDVLRQESLRLTPNITFRMWF
ncbi:carboxypeptidase-like regulatory domain-containing protein [Aquimarina sp. MMG016]|uniref:carboxypeptidase-like regulatory domain-containing protein n=1 Tax=Aquimarina sp. MMG016 TaxID=2822690 RepID=UPI001B3A1EA8|nr:carboxypeptidase-like regulatory domain-containing protein [Aquimarina sp. MMG016]MBQ4822140.1 carboxypeptidase-like regulatory domain-containing protein [Aquimarina sp. MMG016]